MLRVKLFSLLNMTQQTS